MQFSFFKKIKKLKDTIGPGLITGAADDDPSGIATYSQAGAQFGYGQLWSVAFLLPLLVAVQEASARIGAVKGKGIAAVIKENYGLRLLYFVIFVVFFANVINLGADLGAMAAAAQLIIPLSFPILIIFFTLIILALEIFTSYRVYARLLKWLSLFMLAYPLTVFIVKEPWPTLLSATFLPHLEFNLSFLFLFTGIIGTTISPYMFFWQASEEIEEVREKHLLTKDGLVKMTPSYLKRLRLDNLIGMVASQIAAWSIIVVTATVLHKSGITNIATAADAARALEPLVSSFPNSGLVAKSIFAVGVVCLGLLSVPILSGSAAYALAEAFNWRRGLNQKLHQAPGFYAVIIIATLLGLLMNFVGLDPIRALIYTAVMNGIVAVPLIFIIGRISSSQKIMGEYTGGLLSQVLIWLTFIATALAAVSLVFVR